LFKNNPTLKAIITLIVIVLALFLVIAYIGNILIPFVIGVILTYILNPLIEKLHSKLRINRGVVSLIISILVFLLFVSIPLLVIPNIMHQIKLMMAALPDFVSAINDKLLSKINTDYGTNFFIDLGGIKSMLADKVSGADTMDVFKPLANNGILFIKIAVYMILIPVVMFYSSNSWHQLIKFFDNLIPKGYVTQVHNIFNDIDIMLASYLRGQISVMVIMAIYYATGLHIIGLQSGIFIGILTGLLVFIPYIGILIGLLFALAVGFIDSGQSFHQVISILIVFGLGHILEGGLVTPFLVGGRIGLNPIMLIFALMAFGAIFGVVGVLLALPMATITLVLLKHARLYYMKSRYYNEID
jgi:predicted PurR-regulated permease PerM